MQYRSHLAWGRILTILITVFYCATLTLADASAPKRLAFYYGFPSAVNGANGAIEQVVTAFSAFDIVVFGDTLEFPQFKGLAGQVSDFGCTQNSHGDHDNTQTIISRLQAPVGKTQVFGYVSVGGENTYRRCTPDGPPVPLKLAEIKKRVDMWAGMNVTGVFFDEAEYGFGYVPSANGVNSEAPDVV